MWHKPCRTFHLWCLCIKTRCLFHPWCPGVKNRCLSDHTGAWGAGTGGSRRMALRYSVPVHPTPNPSVLRALQYSHMSFTMFRIAGYPFSGISRPKTKNTSTLLALCARNPPVTLHHIGPVKQKAFPWHDVVMVKPHELYCTEGQWPFHLKKAVNIITDRPVKIYDDVIQWKHNRRYWPFFRGIRRSPMGSHQKGQWCVALMFCLICAWINGWVNNR